MRRIVPDTSTIVAAFFPTFVGGGVVNVSPRAKGLVQHIRNNVVKAFAPEQLFSEVAKVCFERCSTRSGGKYLGKTPEDAAAMVREFSELPIEYVSSTSLFEEAIYLVDTVKVSVPDSWFLACAAIRDAELWFTHEHHDKAVKHARDAKLVVFTLLDRPLLAC